MSINVFHNINLHYLSIQVDLNNQIIVIFWTMKYLINPSFLSPLSSTNLFIFLKPNNLLFPQHKLSLPPLTIWIILWIHRSLSLSYSSRAISIRTSCHTAREQSVSRPSGLQSTAFLHSIKYENNNRDNDP